MSSVDLERECSDPSEDDPQGSSSQESVSHSSDASGCSSRHHDASQDHPSRQAAPDDQASSLVDFVNYQPIGFWAIENRSPLSHESGFSMSSPSHFG